MLVCILYLQEKERHYEEVGASVFMSSHERIHTVFSCTMCVCLSPASSVILRGELGKGEETVVI